MTDKKVLNYHIPADFNPDRLLPTSALRNRNIAGPKMMNLRMMLPFTMKCDICSQYIATGSKFTAKSLKLGEEFGIDVYRFHAKCRWCGAEFIFRSEPRISDYVLESGGVRQYEHQKDVQLAKAIDESSDKEEDTEEQQREKVLKEIKAAETIERLRAKGHVLGVQREAAIDKILLGMKRGLDVEEDEINEWKRLKAQQTTEDNISVGETKDGRKIDLLAAYDSE
jgi:hypothetical protein